MIVVAGAAIGAILMSDGNVEGGAAAPPPSATAAHAEIEGVAVRLVLTTNVRERATRQAPIVVIVPEGRLARLTGRTPAGDWLRVVYPPDSRMEGWVPAASAIVEQGDERSVAVIEAPAPGDDGTPAPDDTPVEDRRPDLVITNAFVAPNGTVTMRVANAGTGSFDGAVGLRVTSAEGEIIGVLDIQRTRLDPGRSATVSTQVAIERAGTYLMEIDWLDEVQESGEFNNGFETLLVPGG